MTSAQFLRQTYNAAMAAQNKYGLPALAMIAQSAMETGFGKSTPGNMYFGIKAGSSWHGKKQLLWTHEYIHGVYTRVQDWFRAYDSIEESFDDYAILISSNKIYKAALNFTDDPIAYIQAVGKAGYATDPNYAAKIIPVINDLKKKLKI